MRAPMTPSRPSACTRAALTTLAGGQAQSAGEGDCSVGVEPSERRPWRRPRGGERDAASASRSAITGASGRATGGRARLPPASAQKRAASMRMRRRSVVRGVLRRIRRRWPTVVVSSSGSFGTGAQPLGPRPPKAKRSMRWPRRSTASLQRDHVECACLRRLQRQRAVQPPRAASHHVPSLPSTTAPGRMAWGRVVAADARACSEVGPRSCG